MMLDGLTITGITLTPEACSDILETAIAAGHTYGFGYWAELLSAKQDAHRKPHSGRGHYHSITVREHENADCTGPGKKHSVTHAKLRAAVLVMLQDPKGCGCSGLVSQLVSDDGLDGPLAEAIIQVACFGEVIYG